MTKRLATSKGVYFSRLLLFAATNLAVILVLAVALRVLGIEHIVFPSGGAIQWTGLLAMAAVFGFGGSIISLLLSKWLAKRSTRAQVITEPRTEVEQWLLATVQRLAGQAGIGMPEVAIFDSPQPNAFATGARRDAALVAVSTGLLRSMRQDEVEAVLGHEIAHVANGDMVTMTLLQGVLNTFVIFLSRVIGGLVDRVVFRNEEGYGAGYFITVLVTQLLLGILSTVILMWFSRRREYRADAGSAQLLGKEPMINALRRLGAAQGPSVLPDNLQAFGIRGRRGRGMYRLFLSHPPIDDRIAALQGLQGV